MIKVLLDFPWAIGATLDSDPRPKKLIADFLAFLDHIPFEPAPFVNQQEQMEFMQKLPERHGLWVADLLRFLRHVAHNAVGNSRAIVINRPDDLRLEWERALRDHIDLANWRSPQIIVSSERIPKWQRCIQDHEVEIVLEDRRNASCRRVVVAMQSYANREAHKFAKDYQAHKYALADIDPWDVRHIYYPSGGGTHYDECKLPRPQHLEKIPLDELDDELKRLRSESWPDKGKYWYLPPRRWRARDVATKDDWRKGAFPERATLNRKREHKRGPVDYSDERVWLWDSYEGHWDVQLSGGRHIRINHEGICLD